MTSYLEQVPLDVLQHIAFLLAASSAVEQPPDLLHLLLASSKIYRSLNIHSCPHLYANIFRATFDFDIRLHLRLTDSALATELYRRHRILKCAQRQGLDPTLEELWAALRMILENEGRNEAQLAAAGFTDFITSFVPHHLARDDMVDTGSFPDQYEAKALAMWLLCLTLTHEYVITAPKTTLEDLRQSIRFPLAHSVRHSSAFSHTDNHTTSTNSSCPPDNLHNDNKRVVPDQSSAAIILAFALNEAVPLAIPVHIPQTRAIAIASQRLGPTVEDLRTIASHKTPLFADIRRALISARIPVAYITGSVHNAMHDPELCRVLHASYNLPILPDHQYSPGSLAGLWEGNFLVNLLTSEPKPTGNRQLTQAALSDFRCLKPMQCAISEYLCFSPHIPLPCDHPYDLLETAMQSRRFGYEKSSGTSRRDPSEALDVVILGETLHDHEQAWGGFRFAGRIRSDGLIVMTREPKNQVDRTCLGTWIFEGYLRYGAAFIGQLRPSISTATCDIRGIFSLHKVDPA